MKPCTECPTYKTCVELCDEVNDYANGKRVARRHAFIEEFKVKIEPRDWPVMDFPADQRNRTPLQQRQLRMAIIRLSMDGNTPSQISQMLPITQSYAWQVISGRKQQLTDFYRDSEIPSQLLGNNCKGEIK